MGRPTVRTEYLLRDDAARIRELFGSISNAYRLLSLDGKIPESEFRRAVSFESIREEHKELIENAWFDWRVKYLRETEVLSFILEDETAFVDV